MRLYDNPLPITRRLQAVLVASVTAGLILSYSSVSAAPASSQDITMSPALTEVSIDPGRSASKSFEVVNGGGDSYDVTVDASAYTVEGIEYDPVFKQLPGTTNVASWVSFDKSSARIGSQGIGRFNYTVTVPKNTAPGGYYAVLFAETSPITTAKSTGVIPHNRVGNVLYITVKGDTEMSGSLTPSALNKFIIQPSPISFGMEVSNTGGVHFKTKASFVVESLTGKTLQKTTIERFVLPQTVREISTSWSPSSPIGVYTIKRSATVAGKTETLPDKMIFYARPEAVIIVSLLLLLGAFTIKKLFFGPSNKKPTGKK